MVVGADAVFQSFPAKQAELSIGVGLCGYYLELAGVTVGTDAVNEPETVVNSVVTWLLMSDLRFVERRLEPGDTVYLRGHVSRGSQSARGRAHVDARIEADPELSTFVVADTDRCGRISRGVRSGGLYVGMAIGMFAGGGFVLVQLL